MTKLILMFLFTAAGAGLFAANSPEPVHISPMNKWIIVEKEAWKAPKIDVLIRHADGSVLIRESIKKSTKYNLKYVPDGNYLLELEDGQKQIVQQISVTNGILQGKEITTTFKPRIILSKDYLNLNLMTQGMPATITIRHSSGKIAHTEDTNGEVSVCRKYNIKELEANEYMLDVAINGQVFSQPIHNN